MHMPTKQEIRYQWEHGGPVMAWALIAACTAVWLVEVLRFFCCPTLRHGLVSRGRLAPATMLAEPWAIVTSMFLHAPNSILHILFNMIALYSVGPVLERLIGHWRFLGLYMISGLGGALGMMVWAVVAPGGQGWQTAAYGASGALFGLFAALLVVYRRIGADIRSMLIWMAVNFALPFVVGQKPCLAYAGVWLVGDRVGHRAYRGVQCRQSIWLDVALIPLWILLE